MKRFPRSALVYLLIIFAVLFLGAQLLREGPKREDLDFSTFQEKIDDGDVVTATIKDKSHVVEGKLRDDSDYKVVYPAEYADELVDQLVDAKPAVEVTTDQQDDSMWTSLLFSLLPTVLLVGAFLLVLNALQGGGGRVATVAFEHHRGGDVEPLAQPLQ